MKTLKDILQELLEHRRSLNMSMRTEESFRSLAGFFIRYLEEYCQAFTADHLRIEHVRKYQRHLATLKGRKGLPMKPDSINCRVCAARTMLHFMRQRGYITTDLARHICKVRRPRLLPTSVLTHNQVKKIFRSVDTTGKEGYRDRTILELLYSTGVRGGELAGLTLENVDLDIGVMKVLGKGRKERIVPIGKSALKWLTSYIRGVRPFLKGAKNQNAVFLNQWGRPFSLKSLQGTVPYYAERAKLKIRVTPHTFRRSCATEMIRGNANIYHVKELLGHETVETLKPYTKLTINDLKKTHAKCHPREKDD